MGYKKYLHIENIGHVFGIMDIEEVMKWFSELNEIIYIGDRAGNCIGMFCITLLAFIVGYAAVKSCDSISGRFTISKFADRYIIFMAGIYIAFLIPMIEFINNKPTSVVLLIMAVVFMAAEILMVKTFSNVKKYDYLNPGGCANE